MRMRVRDDHASAPGCFHFFFLKSAALLCFVFTGIQLASTPAPFLILRLPDPARDFLSTNL